MTDHYLPDATDFTDLPVLPVPSDRFASMVGPWVHCPKCQGHGYWNLRLSAFNPKPGETKRQHFQGGCRQCWTWGWVKADSTDATCLHTYEAIAPDQPFRCWHTIQCTQCKVTKSYSSDD